MSQHTYFLYPALLAVCASIWYQQVKTTVHEPYLVRYSRLSGSQETAVPRISITIDIN